jgi:hypothetical protein
MYIKPERNNRVREKPTSVSGARECGRKYKVMYYCSRASIL